jgi:Predicted periplasmic or secreted lipoprotein
VSSRDFIKRLKKAGWVLVRTAGDHHHFKHPDNPHLITVPHPRKDLAQGTLRKLAKIAGIPL